jgi:hypothetical protein
MTAGRWRIGSRTAKLAAVAALLIYAVAMLWPYLAATLVRGSAVTAWNNIATGADPRPRPGQAAGAGLACRRRRRDPGDRQRSARSRRQ